MLIVVKGMWCCYFVNDFLSAFCMSCPECGQQSHAWAAPGHAAASSWDGGRWPHSLWGPTNCVKIWGHLSHFQSHVPELWAHAGHGSSGSCPQIHHFRYDRCSWILLAAAIFFTAAVLFRSKTSHVNLYLRMQLWCVLIPLKITSGKVVLGGLDSEQGCLSFLRSLGLDKRRLRADPTAVYSFFLRGCRRAGPDFFLVTSERTGAVLGEG